MLGRRPKNLKARMLILTKDNLQEIKAQAVTTNTISPTKLLLGLRFAWKTRLVKEELNQNLIKYYLLSRRW
jgi:hypothetical protein